MSKTWKKSFHPLLKYLKPNLGTIRIITALVALEHLAYLVSPTIFGRIIDIVVTEKRFTFAITGLLTLWVFLELFGNWFMQLKDKKIAKVAFEASQELVVKSIDHLMRLPLAYHRNKKTGEVIKRISQADEHLYSIIEEGLFHVVPNVATSVLAFAIIWWISWELALVYILFVIVYISTTLRKTKPIINYQKKLNGVFEEIYGNIFDRLPNIISVKSNTAEEIEYRNTRKGFIRGSLYNYHQVRLWTNLSLWQSRVMTLSFVALFGLGIYYVQLEKITIGQFVMLLTYINMVSLYLNTLADYYKRFQEGLVTITRSERLFDEKTEDYGNCFSIPLNKCKGEIEFKKVCFSYPEKGRVLDGISFKASAGHMVAIVGKSGQGKSTIINMISRYILPESGRISLDGVDIGSLNLGDLRRQIAIVPQEANLFNDTIRNNIRYSHIRATDKQVIHAAKMANCHEFVMKLPNGYDQVIGENGAKLSTGQKQRIAIARAILRNPKILILDEATSALDSESEHLIQKALQEIMKGRTTFVVAHRLSTIRKAHLILVLENGRIIERGDHKELIDHGGVYKKLTQLQKLSV